jgi:hypothetical protein
MTTMAPRKGNQLAAGRLTTTKDDQMSGTFTIGSYLAARLVQIGLKHHFVVAGDYNLVLLDQFLLNKNLQQVYSCNELNCAFSAEVTHAPTGQQRAW